MNTKIEKLKSKCQDALADSLEPRIDRFASRRFAPFKAFRLRRLIRILKKAQD